MKKLIDLPQVTIYCDGGYKKQYNCFGFGTLLSSEGCSPVGIWGGAPGGTNNIGEFTAMQVGLSSLNTPCNVTIVTDSQYAIDCLSKWCYSWQRNNWISSKGAPVKNADIIS